MKTTETIRKRYRLIEKLEDLKVGDDITWIEWRDQTQDDRYRGLITKIEDDTVYWQNDKCSNKNIFDGTKNTFGMTYYHNAVKDTKIARKMYQNNIKKVEDGWIQLKD